MLLQHCVTNSRARARAYVTPFSCELRQRCIEPSVHRYQPSSRKPFARSMPYSKCGSLQRNKLCLQRHIAKDYASRACQCSNFPDCEPCFCGGLSSAEQMLLFRCGDAPSRYMSWTLEDKTTPNVRGSTVVDVSTYQETCDTIPAAVYHATKQGGAEQSTHQSYVALIAHLATQLSETHFLSYTGSLKSNALVSRIVYYLPYIPFPLAFL